MHEASSGCTLEDFARDVLKIRTLNFFSEFAVSSRRDVSFRVEETTMKHVLYFILSFYLNFAAHERKTWKSSQLRAEYSSSYSLIHSLSRSISLCDISVAAVQLYHFFVYS